MAMCLGCFNTAQNVTLRGIKLVLIYPGNHNISMKRQVKQKSPATGAIRIIAGQWRGRKLPVLDVEGLRPTTDRTKETVFNWLAPYLAETNCLDAFAGAGSLGFEALSRYASHCTFVELDKQAAKQILANRDLLKLSAQAADVRHGSLFQQHLPEASYDVVFVDPPFNRGLAQQAIDWLNQSGCLKPEALVYVECELTAMPLNLPGGWQLLKQKQTQQFSYQLYQTGDRDA